DRAVRCTKIDAKTEPYAHELKVSVCVVCKIFGAAGSLLRLHIGSPVGPAILALPRPAKGCIALRSLLPAYFSSTSAGAIAGSRPGSARTMRGSLTQSVFQPRWTSVPENGPAPRMFPIRRYSSAAYPTGIVTDDPSLS